MRKQLPKLKCRELLMEARLLLIITLPSGTEKFHRWRSSRKQNEIGADNFVPQGQPENSPAFQRREWIGLRVKSRRDDRTGRRKKLIFENEEADDQTKQRGANHQEVCRGEQQA